MSRPTPPQGTRRGAPDEPDRAAAGEADAVVTGAPTPTGLIPSARGARIRTGLDRAIVAMLYAVPLTLSWTVAGAHIALGIAAVLVLLRGALCRSWMLARTPADAAFVAFALALCLSAARALPATSNPEPLKKLLLIPFVHVTAAALNSSQRARTGLRLFVIALAVTAIVAGSVFLLRAHAPGARLRSTNHYMTFSGLLLLALPLAGTAAATGPRRLRPAYALATFVMAWAMLLTLTRGAWIGAGVALAVVVARVRRRWLVFVPLLAAAALFLAPAPYRQRALLTFDPTYFSNADRVQMWKAGLAMWREHPWTGVGLGDLKPIYREFASADVPRTYGHLHNDWVHLLATTGILGTAAFAWLMVGFGRIVWRSDARAGDPELRALALGAWGSFWGFQTMGLFEWNFGDVEVMLALYFLVGALQASARLQPDSRSPG